MDSSNLPEDFDSDISKLQKSTQFLISSAVELGELKMRFAFFEELRALILEKDSISDSVAVDILTWAYDRLSDIPFRED